MGPGEDEMLVLPPRLPVEKQDRDPVCLLGVTKSIDEGLMHVGQMKPPLCLECFLLDGFLHMSLLRQRLHHAPLP